jgi:hypothetical protein
MEADLVEHPSEIDDAADQFMRTSQTRNFHGASVTH